MNPFSAFRNHLEQKRIARFLAGEKKAGSARSFAGVYAGENQMVDVPDFHRGRDFLVSIVIPSRDQPDILARCIGSLTKTIDPERDGLQYEIIVVDNGSTSENRLKTNEILKSTQQEKSAPRCRCFYKEEPFSFSRMCNRGAAGANGDLLLFLNDDTEAVLAGWLSRMVSCAQLPQTGAVGAKLLYPEGMRKKTPLIQHCGVVNTRMGPVHKLNRMPDTGGYFLDYNRGVHRVIAVTGACLLIRRDLYMETGGFSEELPVAFNDVDLCYTLYEKGYDILCCNDAVLKHYESYSRGDDGRDIAKMVRLSREYERLMKRHPRLIAHDPFYPEGLTEGVRIAPEVRAEKEVPPYLLAPSVRCGTGGVFRRLRKDACVRAGVECAGRMDRYVRDDELRLAVSDGKMTQAQAEKIRDDYWIRGYSFVIGSDNALYTKRLMLERLKETEDGYEPAGEKPLVFSVRDTYRPEIREQLTEQTNVAFCGFTARIAHGAVAPGVYRVGILQLKHYSREAIYYWGQTVLVAEERVTG